MILTSITGLKVARKDFCANYLLEFKVNLNANVYAVEYCLDSSILFSFYGNEKTLTLVIP